MPRDYGDWEMTDQTRASLSQSMRLASYGDLPHPGDAGGVQALQDRIGREELTRQLAGTTDKKSRAWKNARDQLSRWRRGARGVSGASQGRLRGAGEASIRDRMRGRGSLAVALTVTLRTSKATWTGVCRADLTGRDLSDYLDCLAGNDTTGAAMILLDAYGLDPDYVEEIVDVHGFDSTSPNDSEE